MPSVLFVCTANRFRSPLAAVLFKKALQGSPRSESWIVGSAGTWTSPGLPVLPEVLLIARKYELDLARHRSRLVTEMLLSHYDLILVMEAGHKEALQNEFPACKDQVHLLSQVAEGRTYDIPDLIDSVESMMEVGRNLYDLIRTGAEHIRDFAIHLENTRVKFDHD